METVSSARGSFRLIHRLRSAATASAVILPLLAAGVASSPLAASAAGAHRMISAGGTANMAAAPSGDAAGGPEFVTMGGDAGSTPYAGTIFARSHSARESNGQGGGDNGSHADQRAALGVSFDGLNHVNQRLANSGNQFSVEPPDQGLCAGNGFVMETVNDVFRVFDYSGNPLTNVIDLNTFYGYTAAINRATGVRGPFVTDPSCYYDSATQRWFNTVLTLDTRPNGHFLGPNHIDIAVSNSADPTAGFTIYRLPVQDDGTQGTPDHGCSAGADKSGLPAGHGPCFGDFPHLGADANGFYVTTNEYSFFGPEFHGAQIYAFSKRALARHDAAVGVTQFDTHAIRPAGENGFTIWPATSPSGTFAMASGGTEYFLSTNGGAEAHDPGTGASSAVPSNQVITWAITNTRSLDTTPDLALTNTASRVGIYAQPPASNQKAGSTPLADCLNNVPCATFLNGGPAPYGPETETTIDSSDTREMQVTYAGGYLWGANDTALTLDGSNKAGVEWWVLRPSVGENGVRSRVANYGYLGLEGNNLTYPAIGALPDGRGVMAFTVLGEDHFPSAGYATVDVHGGAGNVRIAKEGLGPDDAFTDYKAFSASGIAGVPRPRWGDYGATAVVGSSVWIASEYIGQTCTLAQYEATPFGACLDAGGNRTRTSLANWDTRISRIDLSDGGNN